jgi:hypothetical protein
MLSFPTHNPNLQKEIKNVRGKNKFLKVVLGESTS